MSKSDKATKSEIQVPKRGTKAAADFFTSWEEIDRFYNFVLSLVGRSDSVLDIAHKALVSVETDLAKQESMIAEHARKKRAADVLKENRQFFVEIIFVRHVENFLGYLSALLFEIFIQRPETLRSSDKIEVSSALRHDSIESLVKELAERKVESLSYSSFSDLKTFFQERFNLVVAAEKEVEQVTKAIEIRNISVHNRCIVNRRFVSRLGLNSSLLGKKHDLYAGDVDQIRILSASIVKELDRIAAVRLHLKGVNFRGKKS